MLHAGVVNPPYAASNLIHQLHAVEQTEEKGVSRSALAAQVSFPQGCWKSPMRHDLHPILEDVNLHVGRAAIVAVGDGVHNRFPQGALG